MSKSSGPTHESDDLPDTADICEEDLRQALGDPDNLVVCIQDGEGHHIWHHVDSEEQNIDGWSFPETPSIVIISKIVRRLADAYGVDPYFILQAVRDRLDSY